VVVVVGWRRVAVVVMMGNALFSPRNTLDSPPTIHSFRSFRSFRSSLFFALDEK
jgi:hypothetical protein